MVIFVDSDLSFDPPPCLRYFFTRSRNSSACWRRCWRSCNPEQNLSPLRRASKGRGWPHQRQAPRASAARPLGSAAPSSGLAAGNIGGATPKRSWSRLASACSAEQ